MIGVTQSERRRDLDGLRGVAITLVRVFHYIASAGFYAHLGADPVLSGFLIGGIILDHGHADNFFRVFYLRRALRILPVARPAMRESGT
jgi:peptidoglycan/LPS O-acetylase OafA/YrhL